MEEILKSKLKEDETLLWSATPEACETLDKTHKAKFVTKAIVIGIVFAVLVAFYIMMAIEKNATIQIPLLLVGMAAAA